MARRQSSDTLSLWSYRCCSSCISAAVSFQGLGECRRFLSVHNHGAASESSLEVPPPQPIKSM